MREHELYFPAASPFVYAPRQVVPDERHLTSAGEILDQIVGEEALNTT